MPNMLWAKLPSERRSEPLPGAQCSPPWCPHAEHALRAAVGLLCPQVITEYKDSELDKVLEACERMDAHLTAAVVSNDVLFQQKVFTF